MLRIGMGTKRGPVAIIGINDDNLIRMQAGMPLDIDLKPLIPPGKRMTRVVIHYAHTYEDVVNDMEKDGLPVTDELRQEARKLDDQLKQEKLKKNQ